MCNRNVSTSEHLSFTRLTRICNFFFNWIWSLFSFISDTWKLAIVTVIDVELLIMRIELRIIRMPILIGSSFLSKSMNVGFSVSKESACSAGYLGSIPRLGRSPGEGNGNPLQYSCLENLIDRGAWWAVVHGVTKSWARLSD